MRHSNWRTFKRLLPLLPAGGRKLLIVFVTVSCVLAAFDAAALMLMAVSLSGMVANTTTQLPLVGAVRGSGYVVLLGCVCGLIISKAVFSVALQWYATRRFATFELAIGDRLFEAHIKAPWTERLQRTTAEVVRLADVGVASMIGSFMLPCAMLPSLITTFVATILALVVTAPLTALVTLAYLGMIGLFLNMVLSRKALQAGRVNRTYSSYVVVLMTDMVNALKEITLRNSAGSVAMAVHDNRVHATRARANINFVNAMPRFVFDGALVGGFAVIGGFAYLISGAHSAFTAVALFGVAGFRIAPSLVLFQNSMTQTHTAAPIVNDVLDDIEGSIDYVRHADTVGLQPIVGRPRELVLKDVAFTYPSATEPAVRGLDLVIPMGSTMGIVGSSGAGKTTLVDLLLGLLVPSTGSLQLDGVDLEDVLMDWRSHVGYVPQEVSLFDGTVAQNVALTWGDDFDRERVEEALKRAQVWDIIEARPGGMDSRVGDRGLALSGGQRQRLGIARALYGDPLVLIMDEATSALDTKTESDVAFAIRNLKGQVTIISVAHRLSTIRDSDQVVFMRDGGIVACGSFDEVVDEVPDFAIQAALAGLASQ